MLFMQRYLNEHADSCNEPAPCMYIHRSLQPAIDHATTYFNIAPMVTVYHVPEARLKEFDSIGYCTNNLPLPLPKHDCLWPHAIDGRPSAADLKKQLALRREAIFDLDAALFWFPPESSALQSIRYSPDSIRRW